ncbi:hypothetical protein L204_101249 [Cryptococcus depauperatus]
MNHSPCPSSGATTPRSESDAANLAKRSHPRGGGSLPTAPAAGAAAKEWFPVPEDQQDTYQDYLDKTIQTHQHMAAYHRREVAVNEGRARRIANGRCRAISNGPASAAAAMHTVRTDLETVQRFLSIACPTRDEYKKVNDACNRILAKEIESYDQWMAACSGGFQKVCSKMTEASELKTSISSVFMSRLQAKRHGEAAAVTQQRRVAFEESGRADWEVFSCYWVGNGYWFAEG